MALPSSPPLLPEQDLPTSPILLPLANSNIPVRPLNRKRQLSEYGSLSSDPLFSDTASEEDEDSERPKRKKVVRGPWWNLGRRGESSLRREMTKKQDRRVNDSGVWMGSDESEESIDAMISSQQRMQELAVEDFKEETVPGTARLEAEALAARVISSCVDIGKETVDLSDLGMTSMSDATLRPLHHLLRPTHADREHPPSEDEFGPLTPSIQLYLSRNQLTCLPSELFDLRNITVLSLRNNRLDHLPRSISRFTKLEELNVTGNSISYLPWELLDLLHCRGNDLQVTVRPNPLVEPCDLTGPSPLRKGSFILMLSSEELSRYADTRDTYQLMREKYAGDEGLSIRAELELRLKLGRMLGIQSLQEQSRAGRELKLRREELIYLASSAVRYFDVDGTPMRRQCTSAEDAEDFVAVLDPLAHAPDLNTTVPSLFELALRSLQANYNLEAFLPHLVSSDLPASLCSAIQLATRNASQHGNEVCSSCGRSFIIARAEWMEYWFRGFSSQQELSPETILPFMRRACSWRCAIPSEPGEFRG